LTGIGDELTEKAKVKFLESEEKETLDETENKLNN
jgi:hypothetical protein